MEDPSVINCATATASLPFINFKNDVRYFVTGTYAGISFHQNNHLTAGIEGRENMQFP